MKKILIKIKEGKKLYYYLENNKIIGINPNLRGDCSGLWGDCSDLQGNCTDLWGDLSLAEISNEERKQKINISLLVQANQDQSKGRGNL